MKIVTSITTWNDAIGKRMSITYSEVDENGAVIADNKRIDRVVTDASAISHADALMTCIHTYILDDPSMFENTMDDIYRRVKKVFDDRDFQKAVSNSGRDNWLRIKASVAFDKILSLLDKLR